MKNFVLFLLALTTASVLAADFPDDSWSQELFAGDLIAPFTAQDAYGGHGISEYAHGLLPSGKSLAVRMVFRPTAMPETAFSDPAARRAWIHDHKPDMAETDTLVKFSKPFTTICGID